MKRLREEVAMLGRLRHPNVVRCLGAVHVQGHFNIFIEWMAGMRVPSLCVRACKREVVVCEPLFALVFCSDSTCQGALLTSCCVSLGRLKRQSLSSTSNR